MASNFDISKTIGDVSKLNDELKKTANIIGEILGQQKTLTSEISKSKGQADLNKKVNQVKQQQNEIEKAGNKLLSTRNTLVAKQSQALKPLTKEVIKQQEATKEMNRQLREQARQDLGIKKRAGLFQSMTKSILSAGAAMVGLTAIFRTLKDAGKLVREFQKENAVLAGVLNKTRKEISALTEDAQRLGATTAKTAKEVTALQIAYARLGFTQEEILNLTEDTINGSIALQAELDETAELTGAMVRSFKELDTTDADLILDQLTLSTQKTALNFQKLQTALPIVAGAASAAGVSFKTVVAQLGQAADRGIDASTAATSLRNVYIELSAKGLTLEQALTKINTSQDKLSTATELFGKRAAVTALALADTQEKTSELEEALDNAGGTAKKVADEQLATLDGSIQLLTSAWQGFILSIEEGDGAIAKLVNGTLRKFADILTVLSNLNLVFKRVSKLTIEEIAKSYDILLVLNNKTGENFRKFVDEYSEVSSRWLQDNKETAIQLLKELDFSNKEAELLYKEHLARLIDAELTAIDASLNASKKQNEQITKESGKVTNKRIKNIEELDSKEAEVFENKLQRATQLTLEYSDVYKRLEEWEKDYTEFVKGEEEKRAELRKQLRQQLISSAVDLGNTLFDLGQSRRDRELESIQNNYQAQIAAAEGNTERQEQLAAQLADEQKRINIQQAKSERNQALFNLAINTAQKAFEIKAQAAVLGSNPATVALVPLALTQLGLLLGTSALQAGLIASQPLPGFFQGTEDAPGGLAWLAEKGNELIHEPDGKTWLAENKGIYDLKEHSKVIPHEQTQQILNSAIMNDIAINGNKGLEDRIDELIYATKNQPREVTSFDDQGIQRYLMSGNSKVNYLNRKGK